MLAPCPASIVNHIRGQMGIPTDSIKREQALGFGEAPHPGLYMVLTGLWFGLVVAFGVWRFARASIGAIASVIAATWIAWEVAINIAMQITEN